MKINNKLNKLNYFYSYSESKSNNLLDAYKNDDDKENQPYEFDIYGVKFVISNDFNPSLVKKCVNQIDELYHYLKNKKLDKVWYGVIYIKPVDFKKINFNTGKAGDVGGNYYYGEDIINIFIDKHSTRINNKAIFLIIHELGHRYWYKILTETQRNAFKSIINIKKEKRFDIFEGKFKNLPIEKDIEVYDSSIISDIENLFSSIDLKIDHIKNILEDAKDGDDRKYGSIAFKINNLVNSIYKEIKELLQNIKDNDISSGIFYKKQPKSRILGNIKDITQKDLGLKPYDIMTPNVRISPDSFYNIPKEEYRLIHPTAEEKIKLIDEKILGLENWKINIKKILQWMYNHLATANYQEKSKPEPVSEYGKSNIEESFAEVFYAYVMNKDMNRDQLDSFKSIINMHETKLSNLNINEIIKLANIFILNIKNK